MKVIIRSRDAGVFYGELIERDRLSCVAVLNDCRRLWYWSGAASLSEVSTEGTKKPQECKFSVRTQGHEIAGVCEVLCVTPEAQRVIEGVPEWTA